MQEAHFSRAQEKENYIIHVATEPIQLSRKLRKNREL
jgi:hypothetical protein